VSIKVKMTVNVRLALAYDPDYYDRI